MDTMEKTEDLVKRDNAQPASEGEITQTERMNGERHTFIPAVDIIDSEAATTLVMDVPGVVCDGVDITIEKNVMTIKAKPEDKGQSCDKPVYSEFRVGGYQRSFSLSDEVDQEHISASVKDGVLRVTLPKAAPVTKKVSVSAS